MRMRRPSSPLVLAALAAVCAACLQGEPRPPTVFEDPNSFGRLRDAGAAIDAGADRIAPQDGAQTDAPSRDAAVDSSPMDSSIVPADAAVDSSPMDSSIVPADAAVDSSPMDSSIVPADAGDPDAADPSRG
jgi:hypothetical protein